MADWSLTGGGQLTQTAPLTALRLSNGCQGLALTPGAAGAVGSWVQFTGTAVSNILAFDASGFILSVDNVTGTNETSWIDVRIGSGGDTSLAAANVLQRWFHVQPRATTSGRTQYIPVPIPAGSEVFLRCASIFAGVVRCALTFIGSDGSAYPETQVAQTLGWVGGLAPELACTGITPLTGNATLDGSWVAIGTTTQPFTQAILSFNQTALNVATTPAALTLRWFVDIGLGASPGVNDFLVENLSVNTSQLPDAPQQPTYGPFPFQVPSGVIISARCLANKSTFNATTGKLGMLIYGFA